VRALEGAQTSWFRLAGFSERQFATEETHHFPVEILVPAGVPAGTYAFRLDVAAEDNPDEDYTAGPSIAFAVPESVGPLPEPTGYLRTLAGTAIGALTGLVPGALIGLVALIILSNVNDNLAGATGIFLTVVVPWIGAAAGAWQALRMADYSRARLTGLLVAGTFLLWEGLLVGLFILLFNADAIPNPIRAAVALLILVPSWVVAPALAARFVALRIGERQPSEAPNRNQPAAT
jgi:hypothetical protein